MLGETIPRTARPHLCRAGAPGRGVPNWLSGLTAVHGPEPWLPPHLASVPFSQAQVPSLA